MFTDDTEHMLKLLEIIQLQRGYARTCKDMRVSLADMPCPKGCGMRWPKRRLELARAECKFERPLQRSVRYCQCNLWVPSICAQAVHTLELSCVRTYLNELYSRYNANVVQLSTSVTAGTTEPHIPLYSTTARAHGDPDPRSTALTQTQSATEHPP